jgi:hypothetical protein
VFETFGYKSTWMSTGMVYKMQMCYFCLDLVCIAHLHLNTLGIYSWSEIQLIPILEGEVERISQHPPTTQTNPQTLVCIINEALSLTPPFNAYITKSYNNKKTQLQRQK